jgi:hypothetical protein
MGQKGSNKGKWKARAKKPTSDKNRRLLMDWDDMNGFISQYMRCLIWTYNVCSVKDQRAWDLFYDILFLEPVTTGGFSPIPADVAATPMKEFAFPGVVGCLPIINRANVWQNP